MGSEWWSLERRSAAYHRAAAVRARRLRAEATTLWLKKHLENEIAQHEQIAAEIERASEPGADAASARAETAFQAKPPDDNPGVRLSPLRDNRALWSKRR